MITISVLDLQRLRLVTAASKKKTHPLEGAKTGNAAGPNTGMSAVIC